MSRLESLGALNGVVGVDDGLYIHICTYIYMDVYKSRDASDIDIDVWYIDEWLFLFVHFVVK